MQGNYQTYFMQIASVLLRRIQEALAFLGILKSSVIAQYYISITEVIFINF